MGIVKASAPEPVSGGVSAVFEQLWLGFRRYWRAVVFNDALAPVLYLLAMGVGLGSLIDSRRGTAGIGTSYVTFLAPALLAATAFQLAADQATIPIYANFTHNRIFLAMRGSPLSPNQIYTGVLLWSAARVASTSVLFFLVMMCFGAVRTPWAVLVVPIATFGAMAFFAPLMAFAAFKERPGDSFTMLFRFVVAPMFLFSGTFYNVSLLPRWAEVLAWASPLWHVIELCRAVALGPLHLSTGLGSLGIGMALVHVTYLAVWLIVGLWLARAHFVRRLSK